MAGMIESRLIRTESVESLVSASKVDASAVSAVEAGARLVTALDVTSHAQVAAYRGQAAVRTVRELPPPAPLPVMPAAPRIADSRFAGLGSGRLFGSGRLGIDFDDTFALISNRASNRPKARLGDFEPTFPEIFASVKSTLSQYANPYDAFVAYTLAHVPNDVKANWTVDSFQIYKALEALAKTYGCTQDYETAFAWGLRFPYDFFADLAGKRVVVDPGQESILQGNVVYHPNTTQVQYLQGTTAGWGYWVAYVYRALSFFIPAAAQVYVDDATLYIPGTAPSDICLENGPDTAALQLYSRWKMPQPFPCPDARFVHWVIAANINQFAGTSVNSLSTPETLNQLMTNDQITEANEGADLAVTQTSEEIVELEEAAVINEEKIARLETLQTVVKVAALPATVCLAAAQAAAEGAGAILAAGIPWWVYAGGAVVVLGLGYIVITRILG